MYNEYKPYIIYMYAICCVLYNNNKYNCNM